MNLKKGQTLHLAIETLTHKGEGLARHEDRVIFVPDALPGDQVTAQVISLKPNYARALIQTLNQPSAERISPPCPYTQDCGGCHWQALDYPAQLRVKRQLLMENLHKVGRVPLETLEPRVQPTLGMDHPFEYRNKGQFPIQRQKGKTVGGFYKPRSHAVVPIDQCLIHHRIINHIFQTVLKLLNAHKVPVYQEQQHTGVLRHALIRHGFETGESMVGFVVREAAFDWQPLVQELQSLCPSVVSVLENTNPHKGSRILGKKTRVIAGKEAIEDQLGTLMFKISLPSFFQINPVQTQKLYNTALGFAQLSSEHRLLDAYAGTGSIALWMAKHVKEVVGIEWVEEAVKDAQYNAQLNGIDNTQFLCGKVEDLLQNTLENPFDCVILDPPRKGCEASVLESLIQSRIPRIVYVSCNPATLARDIERLAPDFELKRCQPVDMFPHTHHLETVCLLERVDKLT